ncbi:hypothetical protein KBC77_04020 [Candidatus Saccharibacteria bacterium]|nr:hypothetical protein [Candidatus Saccharibacteria bacterium]
MAVKTVIVRDSLQEYKYQLVAPMGQDFSSEFTPDLTPKQMLALGVFGGNYFEGEYSEFPASWFASAVLSMDGVGHSELNYFEIDASQSRAEWLRKGWIHPDDPRGWFQRYCRYYMGRRLGEEDTRQIKRWKAIRRHAGQIRANCQKGDELCRRKQRQALLHWAYDSRKI